MNTIPIKTPNQIDLLCSYIDLGFSVVPIWGIEDGHCACGKGVDCEKSPGKHPNHNLAPHGVASATRDKTMLRQWYRQYPNGNWALRAGEPLVGGGFSIVIDVDPRNGGDNSLAQIEGQHGKTKNTVTADTGGNGHHFVLKTSEPCASRAPAPGVELLAVGKYFLVAPSRHMSGNEYTWALGLAPGDVPFAPAPEWAVEAASGVNRPDRDGDTARNTVLGEAFALQNMLGVQLTDGSIAVTCPWADEHSDARGRGEDSSTVILPPAGGSLFGGFRCLHGHCSHRKWQDIRKTMPAHVWAEAQRKFPMRAVTNLPAPDPALSSVSDEDKDQYDIDMEDCKLRLAYSNTKGGYKLKCDIINAITILTYDPRWKGLLKFDYFAQTIRFTRQPEWHPDDAPKEIINTWTEEAADCLEAWFRRTWALDIDTSKILQAVVIVARREGFNPLRSWLDGLVWDGTKRLDKWLSTYLGVDDNDYSRAVGRKWLVSAIARAYQPGCKADHVLILEGPQGRGKSTALSLLAGTDWFTDTPIDIGNKDAYVNLRGKWLIELAELSSLRKADLDRAKAFFSSPVDTYRPPYGRIPADFPRQCIFAGTVNLDQYLSDETGNRRFWPVKCGIIDLEAIIADREQIWAEAVVAFKSWVGRGSNVGECPWWPAYSERHLFEHEQNERIMPDMWAETLTKWLATSDVAKRSLLRNTWIKADVILSECLKIEPADQDKGKGIRLGIAMNAIGWLKVRTTEGKHRGYAYRPSNLDTAM